MCTHYKRHVYITKSCVYITKYMCTHYKRHVYIIKKKHIYDDIMYTVLYTCLY